MEIISIEPNSNLIPVAELYAQVFAGAPWNEVSLCPNCQEFSANQPGSPCSCGEAILSPAYPVPETEAYILAETTKPLAIALLAIVDNQAVGFAWGYQLTAEGFAEKKYKKDASRAVISQVVENITYFYISEVGVDPRYQGQKIGTRLTTLLVANNQLPLLMRTNQDSPMLRIATGQLAMTPVISPNLDRVDPENSGRVILVTFPK